MIINFQAGEIIMKKYFLFAAILSLLIGICGCSGFQSGTTTDIPEKPTLSREFRGVWLRPPSDPDEIPAIMDQIRDAGFNAVMLETLYHGFTIFPGSNVPLRPEYQGRDVLAECIREAHERNLEIHCWTEVFYLQVDTEKYPDLPHSPILDEHPEWLLLTRDGEKSDVSENAHIFADPANPQVQAFLLVYYENLLRNYDIDGINLDYIRYSAGSKDTGYTDFARKAFKNQEGVDPINIEKEADAAMWMKWVEWRENRVTDFVSRVRSVAEEEKPEVLFSAAIFPGYYPRRGEHFTFQDWGDWLKKRYLDAIIPMAYAPTLDGIKGEINQVTKRNPGTALVLPALAISKEVEDAYGGRNHPHMKEQINLVRDMGLKGHSTFCYSWILQNKNGFEEFREDYKKPAASTIP